MDSILRKLEAEAGYREFYLWGRSMGAAVTILYAENFLSVNLKEKIKFNKKAMKRKRKKSRKSDFDQELMVQEKKNEEMKNPPSKTVVERTWKDKVKFLILDSPFTSLFEMIQGEPKWHKSNWPIQGNRD